MVNTIHTTIVGTSNTASAATAAAASASSLSPPQNQARLIDRLNGIAVPTISFDNSRRRYYPKINGLELWSAPSRMNSLDDNTTEFIFEKFSHKYIKLTTVNPWQKWRIYVERTPTNKGYKTYSYLPDDNFTKEEAIFTFCTLAEDKPHYKITHIAFNRLGVGIIGKDAISNEEFFCWASQNDFSVKTMKANITWVDGSVTVSAKNGPQSFTCEYGGYMLNGEAARGINLDDFRNPAGWPLCPFERMKEEKRLLQKEATQKSKIKVANNTPYSVEVSLDIDDSAAIGMNHYDIRINNNILIQPVSAAASGNTCDEFYLVRSCDITFDYLASLRFVRMTEIDDRSTNVFYVDVSRTINGIAYKVFNYLPRTMSLGEVEKQVKAADVDSDDVEMVAYNEFGTILAPVEKPKYLPTGSKTIFHGSPDDLILTELQTRQYEREKTSQGVKIQIKTRSGYIDFQHHELVNNPTITRINGLDAGRLTPAQISALGRARIQELFEIMRNLRWETTVFPKDLCGLIIQYVRRGS